jgi:hypothetical protein
MVQISQQDSATITDALRNTAELERYHIVYTSEITFDATRIATHHVEADYVAPTDLYMKVTYGAQEYERLRLGRYMYEREDDRATWAKAMAVQPVRPSVSILDLVVMFPVVGVFSISGLDFQKYSGPEKNSNVERYVATVRTSHSTLPPGNPGAKTIEVSRTVSLLIQTDPPYLLELRDSRDTPAASASLQDTIILPLVDPPIRGATSETMTFGGNPPSQVRTVVTFSQFNDPSIILPQPPAASVTHSTGE